MLFGLLSFEEILIWALLVSFLMAVVYRIFIDPKKMAAIKKDLDFYKKKMNAENKVGENKKYKEIMGEMRKGKKKRGRT